MQNMQGAGEDNLIKTGNYYYTYTIESNSHRSTGQEINKKMAWFTGQGIMIF